MNTINNRRIVIIFILTSIFTVVLLFLVVKVFLRVGVIDENTTVAKVNNEQISFREFNKFMAENRAETMNYFRKTYGSDVNDKEFWEKRFGEEIPIEVLKQRTLDQLTRIKVQQVLAREKGLVEDISYTGFLKLLKDENKKRREALARNEVIYGPQQYGEKEFFHYRFSNMVTDLKKVLEKDELSIDNEKLKIYYEEIKSKYYKYPDTIKIKRLFVNYSISGNRNTLSENQAKKEMEELAGQIDHHSFDEAVKQIAKSGNSNYSYEEHVFDMKNRKEDLDYHETTIGIADKLSEGQISEVFKDENRHCFSIIKCVEKIQHGYREFDDEKELVKISYIEKKYNDLIDKMVEEASIVVYKEVVDKVKADYF